MFGQQPSELLRQVGKKIELPAGSIIYGSEWNKEETGFCHYLESGCCALSGFTRSGEERVFAYCDRPRLLGFLHLMPWISVTYFSEDFLPIHIVTKTSCVLYRIEKPVFDELLNGNPDFQRYVTTLLSQNYADILHRYHIFHGECATVRLCDLLLTGARETDGVLMMPSFFNYGELSRFLGIHVVTVSRIMVQLKQRGLIEKRGHRIVLSDPDGLKALIVSQANFDF